MRSTSAAYGTENAKENKFPVVLVQFAGVTREYASQTFSGIGASVKKHLRAFTMNLPKIDLTKGIQDVGQINFTVEDIDLDVTSTLNTDPLVDSDITVKYGYQSLTEANFVTLPTYKMKETNPSLLSDLQTYSFQGSDIRRLLRGDIGISIPKTNLNEVLNPTGPAEVLVESSSGFIDPTGLPTYWPSPPLTTADKLAHFKVDEEIVAYFGIADATHLGDTSLGLLQAGRVGSAPSNLGVTHAKGAAVTQCYLFDGMHPTEVLLHILLTTTDGSGHAFYDLGVYDSGFFGIGLGDTISASDVDIEGIERLGWRLFNQAYEQCSGVIIHERVNAVQWLSDNILIPGGLFLYINGNGQIAVDSVDRLSFIDDFTSVKDYTKDDIDVTGYEIDHRNTINHIELQHAIKPFTGSATSTFCKLDNSVTQYVQRESPVVITSPLVRRRHSNYINVDPQLNGVEPSAAELADVVARRWFYTFGNPLGNIKYNAQPDEWLAEPTDQITITHDKIPDTLDGGRGWTSKKFYVTSQKMTPLSNPPIFGYEAFTWEAYDKVANFYNFTTILQGSIDDTTVTFSTTNSTAVEGADGHHEPTPSTDTVWVITLTIAPPDSGTTHHAISIAIRLQLSVAVPTLFHLAEWRGIRYFSGDSAAFDIKLTVFATTLAGSVGLVKVDWYDATASSGSGERPTITFKQIDHSAYGQNITIL